MDGIRVVSNWRVNALCAEIPGDLWFADSTHTAENKRAKQICKECPVRQECLEDALVHNMQHGIWGGMTPLERRSLKRKMKR